MTEPENKKSTTLPAIIMTVGACIMLLGVGRCGFLRPMIHGVYDDYGISGACCLILGFILLVVGLIWFTDRRRL